MLPCILFNITQITFIASAFVVTLFRSGRLSVRLLISEESDDKESDDEGAVPIQAQTSLRVRVARSKDCELGKHR